MKSGRRGATAAVFFTRSLTPKGCFLLKVKVQHSMFPCLEMYMLPLILPCALLSCRYLITWWCCSSKSCSHTLTGWSHFYSNSLPEGSGLPCSLKSQPSYRIVFYMHTYLLALIFMHPSYLSLEFKGLTFGCTNVRVNISMEINPCLPGHLGLFAHKIPSDISFLCKCP